ncbi:MAG: type VII secretion target [Dermatophilaceae bacterium]
MPGDRMEVRPEDLRRASRTLTDATDRLSAMFEGTAPPTAAFADVGRSRDIAVQASHFITTAVAERLTALVSEGDEMAATLDGAAGRYEEQDQQSADGVTKQFHN